MFIKAIGLAAPGLPDWPTAIAVLNNNMPYQINPLDRYKPTLLPANERRRATNTVRLAFRVCEEACREYMDEVSTFASVFASSGGDYDVIDAICRVLGESDRSVSPTQFHNSVHNAAAGYWSIATRSMQGSTSLSAFNCSFAGGLLEAGTLISQQKKSILLAAYDTTPPQPIAQKHHIQHPFAVALLLSPNADSKAIAKLSLRMCQDQAESLCENTALEPLRVNNPAARSLPLLELLAQEKNGTVSVKYPGNRAIEITLSHTSRCD